MADPIGEAIARRHDPQWHDDELLSPAGQRAHAARVRALAGDRQARLDLEARWQPVTKEGAVEDAPLIDPGLSRTYAEGDGLNFTVY